MMPWIGDSLTPLRSLRKSFQPPRLVTTRLMRAGIGPTGRPPCGGSFALGWIWSCLTPVLRLVSRDWLWDGPDVVGSAIGPGGETFRDVVSRQVLRFGI